MHCVVVFCQLVVGCKYRILLTYSVDETVQQHSKIITVCRDVAWRASAGLPAHMVRAGLGVFWGLARGSHQIRISRSTPRTVSLDPQTSAYEFQSKFCGVQRREGLDASLSSQARCVPRYFARHFTRCRRWRLLAGRRHRSTRRRSRSP